METAQVAARLRAAGRGLGEAARIVDVHQTLTLPHATVELQAVVADAGLLAVLYRHKAASGVGITLSLRRGTRGAGAQSGLPQADPGDGCVVSPDPGGPDGEAVAIVIGELLPPPLRTPGPPAWREIAVPVPVWAGTVLDEVEVSGARIALDGHGFGGLGGTVTATMHGTGSLALTLGRTPAPDCFWAPPAGTPQARPEPADSGPPPPIAARPPAWPSAEATGMVAAVGMMPHQLGVGRCHFLEVLDPDRPVLADHRAFAWPLSPSRRPLIICMPTVWERVVPTIVRLSGSDAGRTLRLAVPDAPPLVVAVLGATADGEVEWAARFDRALPQEPALLHRQGTVWTFAHGRQERDGWHRGRSPQADPGGAAELACVAVGVRGNPIPFRRSAATG